MLKIRVLLCVHNDIWQYKLLVNNALFNFFPHLRLALSTRHAKTITYTALVVMPRRISIICYENYHILRSKLNFEFKYECHQTIYFS